MQMCEGLWTRHEMEMLTIDNFKQAMQSLECHVQFLSIVLLVNTFATYLKHDTCLKKQSFGWQPTAEPAA